MTAEIIQLGQQPRDLEEHVAGELRATMARLGVTQGELATALHISRSEISKILTGDRPIKLQFIERASRALGIEPADLFGWTPPTPPPGPGQALLAQGIEQPPPKR